MSSVLLFYEESLKTCLQFRINVLTEKAPVTQRWFCGDKLFNVTWPLLSFYFVNKCNKTPKQITKFCLDQKLYSLRNLFNIFNDIKLRSLVLEGESKAVCRYFSALCGYNHPAASLHTPRIFPVVCDQIKINLKRAYARHFVYTLFVK